MKKKHLIMGVALILAAGFAVFGNREPTNSLSEPLKPEPSDASTGSDKLVTKRRNGSSEESQISSAPSTEKTKGIDSSKNFIPLYERQKLIGRDESDLQGNLFSAHSWTPPPIPVAAVAPPPPTAPPIPFKYLGKLNESDLWQVFISRGSSTFIVKKGDVIEDQYQVQEIEPPSMTLLYLPLKQVQSFTIE